MQDAVRDALHAVNTMLPHWETGKIPHDCRSFESGLSCQFDADVPEELVLSSNAVAFTFASVRNVIVKQVECLGFEVHVGSGASLFKLRVPDLV